MEKTPFLLNQRNWWICGGKIFWRARKSLFRNIVPMTLIPMTLPIDKSAFPAYNESRNYKMSVAALMQKYGLKIL